MTKIGRNDPCPCGSGKKFKRCHGALAHLDRLQFEIPKMVARAQASEAQRQRQQGMGRPIISVQTETGHRLVAVRNRLMYSKGWKTFHDFLVDYIKTALGSGSGSDWGASELAKPSDQRHPILNWYQLVGEQQRTYITEPGKVSSAEMTGAIAAFMFLAYDLYALDHNAELQEKLVARLRNRDNFEGARYEVFVAATLIRAGFEIEFENEDDRTTTHCEFTATFTRTGKRFSVEAKHRAGARLRMGHLLIGALQKRANHPRIVFIDINMPDDGSEANGSALMNSAVRKLRGFEHKTINGQQLPPAYLIVTNTPWHHHLESTSFRCCMDVDGFQIPDFKANVMAPSLRAAIEARESHIELHELMRSIQDHSNIPATFDGDVPEFAFGDGAPRLVIGRHYLVTDHDAIERPGELTTATVMEAEKRAVCGLTLDNGTSIICTWPLSDEEIAAWRRHPDTFFGVVTQRSTKVETPLQLYDFFLDGFKQTPKERLLERMTGAPDFQELTRLDQPKLASIFAERSVYGAIAAGLKFA
ncbi:preprotein translocase subunit SecA [Pandoraea terrae]|uniref:Preprotein translocase subunit SecA n=1 Tax=Pandoraea terrae TaxID=1537710 RepID=A0A5E4UCZ4_9BURK|nr:SEC-C metal-binding domain-containing protein [Pandoraea terrae]VVD96908.1 preprotein translocase subunit SecA [Pandoraea terrae]